MKIKASKESDRLVELGSVKCGEVVNIGGGVYLKVNILSSPEMCSCVDLHNGSMIVVVESTKVQVDDGEYYSPTVSSDFLKRCFCR